jgi:hypothetical protein
MIKVEVFWDDSSGPIGWTTIDLAKQYGVGQCKSIGYLFQSTKDFVKICQSEGDGTAIGNLLIISRKNVKRVRRLT